MSKLNSLRLNHIQLPHKVAVLGKGMLRNNKLLSSILQTHIVRHYPLGLLGADDSSDAQAYIGWGNKKSYQRAKRRAKRHDLPIYSIEDGFLRSIDSGINSLYALSVVIDDLGVYFDLSRPSRLESMVCHRFHMENWSTEHQHIAHTMITKIIDNRLSKYNNHISCPNLDEIQPYSDEPYNTEFSNNKSHVLLIDQVYGDKSIAGACGNESTGKKQFVKMLKTALQKHPQSTIWIKSHPAGKKGYLTDINVPQKYKHRINVLEGEFNPIDLLKQVSDVYTVSSHMGFEALMLNTLGYNISVHCFGVAWYSGWGVTDDSGLKGTAFYRKNTTKKLLKHVESRRKNLINQRQCEAKQTLKVSVHQLFFAAYLDYCHYIDPATTLPCNIDTAIDWLATNRHWYNTLKGELTVYEFSRWKLAFVKEFVGFSQTNLFIKPKPRLKNLLHPDHFRVKLQNPLLVWGLAKQQHVCKKLMKAAIYNNATSSELYNKKTLKSATKNSSLVYCMEDGFIRSNGLGATLLAPLSVVIDTQGIYYNATVVSDLESLLKNCPVLTDLQVDRVKRLQCTLLNKKVSKYNVGKSVNFNTAKWLQEVTLMNKRKIFIVGQVEDDLSVQYCGSLIKTNTDLIKRVALSVKENNIDAYLIYKPHPDVEAGLRTGKVDKETLKLVHAVAKDVAMPDCLNLIDEVHTISSLTGFEALLRDKKVACYGLPFYAGWGLTTDIDCHLEPKASYLTRRKRNNKLTLQQLIHSTLIDYPMYRLPNGYGLAQVEQVIHYLYPVDMPDLNEKKDKSKLAVDMLNNTVNNNVITNAEIPISANDNKNNKVLLLKQHLIQSSKTRFMQVRHKILSNIK